jgi:hypothetical protein
MPHPTVHPVSYNTTNLILRYAQYYNRILSDITTNEKYQHQFSLCYWGTIQHWKKKVCCGEIIPTNVNFQLYGTGNRSKRPPPSCTLNSARLKENLLPFWWFHYCPFCSQQTPRFVAWVIFQPVLFVSNLCPSRVPTWSSHGEWDLVTSLARRVDQNRYKIKGTSVCQRWR